MDTGGKNKSPRQQQQQKVGNKRKRVQKAHVFYDDDNEEGEKEAPNKRQKCKREELHNVHACAFL